MVASTDLIRTVVPLGLKITGSHSRNDGGKNSVGERRGSGEGEGAAESWNLAVDREQLSSA